MLGCSLCFLWPLRCQTDSRLKQQACFLTQSCCNQAQACRKACLSSPDGMCHLPYQSFPEKQPATCWLLLPWPVCSVFMPDVLSVIAVSQDTVVICPWQFPFLDILLFVEFWFPFPLTYLCSCKSSLVPCMNALRWVSVSCLLSFSCWERSDSWRRNWVCLTPRVTGSLSFQITVTAGKGLLHTKMEKMIIGLGVSLHTSFWIG